jgi:translocation and assembly module TamB
MNQLILLLRSALRYVAALVGTVMVALLLLVGFLGFTVPGARVVAWAIEKYAATPDQIVRISDPGALLTGDFTAGSVTLFDGKGIYAEVRDLSVNWSPAELLSMRFDAARVSAGSVRLERLPIPSQETKEVRSTLALPVDVRIDAFDLEQIVIGKALAGEDQVLTATGSLDATASSVALAFDAAERDRPKARATADLVFNPAGNQLKIEAQLAEPKGGLLAKMLQLPGEPAVDITLTGEGPLSDWSGSATASLGGSEILRLHGRHVLAADGMHNLSLSGGGAFAPLLPDIFKPLFDGTTDIDLTAAFDGKSMLRIEAGKLSTGALTLNASGTVDSRGENNLQASLTGTSGAIDFRWPLRDGELRALINTANLSLIGEGQSAILDIAADAASVALPQVTLGGIRLSAQSDDFNLESQSGSLETTIEINESRFASADLDRAIRAPMKLDGTIAVAPDAIRFDPLTIESASIGGAVSGNLDRADGMLEAGFKLFAIPAVLPPALAGKFDGTIAVSGNVATEAGGQVQLSELEIRSGTFDASGSLALADGSVTADIKGNLPNLGSLLADAKGAAAFHAAISGPLGDLGVKAEMTSSGATLAGRTLSDLAVNADATVTGGNPQVKLAATGTLDGQAIDIRADVVSENGRTSVPTIEGTIGGNRLTGTLDLSSGFKPSGTIDFNMSNLGLITAMAGQPVSGDLSGSATFETADSTTSVAIKAQGSSIGLGTLTVAGPEVDIRIADIAKPTINGEIRAESVALGENRVSDLSLTLDEQQGATGFSLEGRYDGAPLTASGVLGLDTGRTEVRLASASAAPKGVPLRLASPTIVAIEEGVARLDAVTIQASTGTISVTGTAGDRLDLSARIDSLPAGLIDRFAPTLGARGMISGSVDVSGEAQAPVIEYDFTWSDASVASTRSIGIARQDLGAKGTVTVAEGNIRFDPTAIDSSGFRGNVTGTLDRTDTTAEASFEFVAEPGVLPAGLTTRFDAPITVSGKVETGGGSIKLSALDITSNAVTATGSATIADGGLTADVKGTLPDLGKLLADAQGKAAFSADVSGPLDALAIKGEMTSSGATLAGRSLTDLMITADATLEPGSPQANLTATGALGGQAIDVRAEVVSKEGRTSIPTLEAKIGDNRLTGALNLTPEFRPDGTIDFNLPDLGLIAAMAGQKASGDLSGSASIRTADGTTSISLKASGSAIKRDALTIAKPVADISIADVAALAIRGSIKAESVAQGQNRVSNVNLTFEQQDGRTGFAIDGNHDGAPLTARGDMVSVGGRTEIRLASFAAAPKRIPLKLARPTVVAIENGVVRLGDLTLEASRGTIAVTGTAGENLDISTRLNALPAALIDTFAPTLGAEGTIDGTVEVRGTAAAPVVTYDLRWSGASVAATRSAGVTALDVSAKGRFADNRVTLDATVSGPGELSFRGGGHVDIGGNMPMEMKFAGDAPFALIANILAESGFTLTGSAKVDLTLSGSARAPQITGTIATSGSRLVDVRRNLAFNDLAADVRLDGQQATISRLSANLATGGSIEASGTVGIAAGSSFPADLRIRLNDATYVDGTVFTANLAGDLTLKGPLVATPALGGRLTIRRAAITIPEKLPTSLAAIDIKHKNAPARVRQMARDVRRDTSPDAGVNGDGIIAFDLAVHSPGQFFVRGRGIDAELGGDLTIRGTAARPIVSGGFDMRRGRLEILGKRLTFTEGHIGFGGDLIPTLDLDATSSAGSTTIIVNVAGPANNPRVTFSSSPALPQDEILAQLIFNRSLNNLSAFQIAQLASAVSQLAGGGSTSVLDGLRNKLGVDDLDITTDESGGAQVRAGKYLNDRTYIELQQGSDSASSKAIINLDVGRGVKLKGEAAGDGSAAGGIFFEREY